MRSALGIAGVVLLVLSVMSGECRAQSSSSSSTDTQSLSESASTLSSRLESSIGNMSGSSQSNSSDAFSSERAAKSFGRSNTSSSSSSSRASQSRSTVTRRSASSSRSRNTQRSARALRNNRTGLTTTEPQPLLSLGFVPVPMQGVGAVLTARIEQSKGLTLPMPVQLGFQDGVATISGTVASEHDRALAEQLLALEPGVRRVENRLTVAQPENATKAAGQ